MFKGDFKEGVEQTAVLELIDGVVSVRAFENLAQWLCTGRVTFKEPTPEESISAAIELSHFVDMCGIVGTENLVADHIRDIIRAGPVEFSWTFPREPGTNTQYITSEHIISASQLPLDHAVREILATAVVEEYIQRDSHKFAEECHNLPGFSADLLEAAKKTLLTVRSSRGTVDFKEPLSEKMMPLYRSTPINDSNDTSDWSWYYYNTMAPVSCLTINCILLCFVFCSHKLLEMESNFPTLSCSWLFTNHE